MADKFVTVVGVKLAVAMRGLLPPTCVALQIGVPMNPVGLEAGKV